MMGGYYKASPAEHCNIYKGRAVVLDQTVQVCLSQCYQHYHTDYSQNSKCTILVSYY